MTASSLPLPYVVDSALRHGFALPQGMVIKHTGRKNPRNQDSSSITLDSVHVATLTEGARGGDATLTLVSPDKAFEDYLCVLLGLMAKAEKARLEADTQARTERDRVEQDERVAAAAAAIARFKAS